MKLSFVGTRGYIEPRSIRHHMQSALLVSYYGRKIMVDCGEDWLGHVRGLCPRAIVITHAHPDHAGGLADCADRPVYATEESWQHLQGCDVPDRRVLAPRRPVEIEGLTFEAFAVEHSTRAPAVGYRIAAGQVTMFYVPDVVYIHDRHEALSGVKLYVGDGASVSRSMVRKHGESLIGHTPIRTQLTWCREEGVPRAIFTHLGSEIVGGDEEELAERVRGMGCERGVEVQLAYDGMEVVLR